MIDDVVLASMPSVIEWTEEERAEALKGHFWVDSLDDLSQRIAAARAALDTTLAEVPADQQEQARRTSPEARALFDLTFYSARHPADREEFLAGYPERDVPVSPWQLVSMPDSWADAALACPALMPDYDADRNWHPVVARFGLRAEGYLVRAATRSPVRVLPSLGMLGSTDLAQPAARVARSSRDAKAGQQWLFRFPRHAVAGLIPAALGKPGRARDDARWALRFLNGGGHGVVVTEVAGTAGGKVAAAVNDVLGEDPLDVYPSKIPPRPTWLDVAVLPPLVLRDGGGALPIEALETIVEMLAISTAEQPYAGMAIVESSCTPESLREFVWAIFTVWLAADAPMTSKWVLQALGLLGDDEIALRLAPVLNGWYTGSAKFTMGIRALVAIGTDQSLMLLHRLGEMSKYDDAREAVRDAIAEIAEARGTSPDDLADRLVPWLGLDQDGRMSLDFGSHSFVVGFDELLRPFVTDRDGARLDGLPKRHKDDDPELVKSARDTWNRLKRDAALTSKIELRRLERAMCSGRRWPIASFRSLIVDHPLLRHIARRILWVAELADGREPVLFRVAEDFTWSDENDDRLDLPQTAKVGIVHPLDMAAEVLAHWESIFSDYELLQPFPQLDRTTFSVSDAEQANSRLHRFDGVRCHFGRILALEQRGWKASGRMREGLVDEYVREFATGLAVVLYLETGVPFVNPSESEEQQVAGVACERRTSRSDGEDRTFGELSALEFSEVVRDLQMLRA